MTADRERLAAALDDLELELKKRVTAVFAPFLTGGAPNTMAWELVDEVFADEPLNRILRSVTNESPS